MRQTEDLEILVKDGWTIRFVSSGRDLAEQLSTGSSEELIKNLQVSEYLKDDKRSLVALFLHDKDKLIFKIPREKNRRKWIRLTTLYRNSEVKRNFLNLLKLQQLGIVSNVPLLFAEKRRNGTVTDSFIIYSYLKGERIGADDYQHLIKEIDKLYRKGYLHGDFHSRNFLKTDDNRIAFLDTAFRRNFFGSIGRCYEMLYFSRKDKRNVQLHRLHKQFFKENYSGLSLFLAYCLHGWLEIWRAVKRIIRSLI